MAPEYRLGMDEQRHDLGAMFVRLGQVMINAELPVLEAHDVEMWDYVILIALRDGPAQSQSRLAAATRRDKTRLIPILDRLEGQGLLRREPDPADRRNRIVDLTEPGRALVADCQGAIRRMEHELLAELPEADRVSFITQLERVSALLRVWG